MFLILKLVQWLSGSFTGWVTTMIAVGKFNILTQGAIEAGWRIVRITVVTAILIAAVNAFVPPNFNLVTIWGSYIAESGDWLQYVGLVVPLDLLFICLDVLIFASVVIVMFRMVRFIDSVSK